MSFITPLPTPGSAASSSIWARRMITKSVPTSEAEVELNVLSLLLDVPLASLDEASLTSPISPVSLHSPATASSAWSNSIGLDNVGPFDAIGRSASPIQRSKSADYYHQNDDHSWEMHTAQTAVKAALDVLEEPSLSRGLRISTSVTSTISGSGGGGGQGNRGCLTAPISPALSSPVSPAESSFSANESDGTKKKGRARMSQEKRKRLARRREREALVASITTPSTDMHMPHMQMQYSHSAPVTPIRSQFHPSTTTGFPFAGYDAFASTPISSPRFFDLPASPALTTASTATAGFGGLATPSSSPTSTLAETLSSSPPTLVIQPPSPQRLRVVKPHQAKQQQRWTGFTPTHLASVY
ncbi:uncharacterized protein UTRI_00989_B [Ustilago trichophora]|uniref:Uncharacterized protein n=1 Tax=Ustilago trichophora TaxID=86804 RepID=A0A5C3DTE6_9BASI|nr:uncharacterized protein UTRI_00989_B [Ustilago trichophora]